MAGLKNRRLKKGCVSDFFVLFKGGVYTFLVRRFFACAYLVVARMDTFFLYSIYFRFIIASQI